MRRSIAFRALAFVGILLAGLLFAAPPTAALDVGHVLELSHLSPLSLPTGGLCPTQLVSARVALAPDLALVSSGEVVAAIMVGASTEVRSEVPRLRPDPGNAFTELAVIEQLAQPSNRT
jgi:hypothetical protein